MEPAGAAVLSGGQAGSHQMPGIGVGFIPAVLNRLLLDEVVVVTDAEAFLPDTGERYLTTALFA